MRLSEREEARLLEKFRRGGKEAELMYLASFRDGYSRELMLEMLASPLARRFLTDGVASTFLSTLAVHLVSGDEDVLQRVLALPTITARDMYRAVTLGARNEAALTALLADPRTDLQLQDDYTSQVALSGAAPNVKCVQLLKAKGLASGPGAVSAALQWDTRWDGRVEERLDSLRSMLLPPLQSSENYVEVAARAAANGLRESLTLMLSTLRFSRAHLDEARRRALTLHRNAVENSDSEEGGRRPLMPSDAAWRACYRLLTSPKSRPPPPLGEETGRAIFPTRPTLAACAAKALRRCHVGDGPLMCTNREDPITLDALTPEDCVAMGPQSVEGKFQCMTRESLQNLWANGVRHFNRLAPAEWAEGIEECGVPAARGRSPIHEKDVLHAASSQTLTRQRATKLLIRASRNGQLDALRELLHRGIGDLDTIYDERHLEGLLKSNQVAALAELVEAYPDRVGDPRRLLLAVLKSYAAIGVASYEDLVRLLVPMARLDAASEQDRLEVITAASGANNGIGEGVFKALQPAFHPEWDFFYGHFVRRHQLAELRSLLRRPGAPRPSGELYIVALRHLSEVAELSEMLDDLRDAHVEEPRNFLASAVAHPAFLKVLARRDRSKKELLDARRQADALRLDGDGPVIRALEKHIVAILLRERSRSRSPQR